MTKRAAAATFLLISAAAWATATGTTSTSPPPPPPDRPTGLLVLGLHPPERVAVMDVASGHLSRRGLPSGTLCHGPLMASGNHAVWIRARGRTQVAMAQPLDLRRPAHALGRADLALSGEDGRLWLVRLRYGRSVRAVDVRAVTSGGVTLMRSRYRAPVGYPEGATGRALVIGHGRQALLWEPSIGWAHPAPGAWLMAARGRRAAWCSEGCARVRVTGGSRTTRSAALPGRTLVVPRGSFSPDGRLLALASTQIGAGPAQIELVDTESGRTRLVPGTTLSEPGGFDWSRFDWSGSGHWLYFAAPGRRVRAYRPADGRIVTLPRRLPGDILSLAAAG